MNNQSLSKAKSRRKGSQQPAALNVDQMRALGSPLRLELFQRIAGGEATATALAESMALPVTRLYHHLRQLTETALIEVAAETKKRGTIERSYQLTATGVHLDPASVAGVDGTGGPGAASVRAALRLTEERIIGMASNPSLAPYGLLEQELVRLDRPTARLFRARLDRLLADLRRAHVATGELELLLTVALAPQARATRGSA